MQLKLRVIFEDGHAELFDANAVDIAPDGSLLINSVTFGEWKRDLQSGGMVQEQSRRLAAVLSAPQAHRSLIDGGRQNWLRVETVDVHDPEDNGQPALTGEEALARGN